MTLVADPPTISPPETPAPSLPPPHAPEQPPVHARDAWVEQAQARVSTLYADPETFRRWLEGLEAGTIVGQKGDASACPLATFGHHQLGWQRLSVYGDRIQVWQDSQDDHPQQVPSPQWCTRFVFAIDRGPYALISAARALEALHSLGRPGKDSTP